MFECDLLTQLLTVPPHQALLRLQSDLTTLIVNTRVLLRYTGVGEIKIKFYMLDVMALWFVNLEFNQCLK